MKMKASKMKNLHLGKSDNKSKGFCGIWKP